MLAEFRKISNLRKQCQFLSAFSFQKNVFTSYIAFIVLGKLNADTKREM